MTPNHDSGRVIRSWIDYAKAHNYWLVIVYHEVVPDSAPRCTNTDSRPRSVPGLTTTRRITNFFQSSARLHLGGRPRAGRRDRSNRRWTLPTPEMHGPVAGTVKITPRGSDPRTTTLTANPSAFTDPDGDALTYQHQWGVPIGHRRATGGSHPFFDLSAGRTRRRTASSQRSTSPRRDPQGHVTTGVSDSVTIGSTPKPTPGPIVTPTTPTLPAPPVASAGSGRRRRPSRALTGRRRRSW